MGVTVRTRGRVPTQVWDAAASADLAAAAVAAIDARAFVRGRDVADQPFAPYSADYQEQLREAGESTRVDLTRSGALRRGVARSVSHVSTGRVVLSLPADVRERAERVQGRRAFWGLSRVDLDTIVRLVRALVARRLGVRQ